MDIFTQSFGTYLDWVAAMDPRPYWTVVRGAVALLIPVAIGGIVFHRLAGQVSRHTLVTILWLALVTGVLLAIHLPIDQASMGHEAKGVVLIYAILMLAALPWGFAYFVVPHAGWRRAIAWGLYVCLLVAIHLAARS